MKQTLLQEKYPVYSLELERGETSYQSVNEIVGYFRERIEAHRVACFIAEFDHYAHTRSLPEGQIGEDILAAKTLVFCFGITLPDPHMLAVRPRSIGVAQTTKGFLVTFMEAPMPVANAAMEDWAKGLRNERKQPDSLDKQGRIRMRIGVTSQNFRTITGHAGKTRRFLVFEASGDETPREVERLDLSREMSLHEYQGNEHPLFQLDAVITASAGEGFVRRLSRHGVRVVTTSEPDPATATAALVAGKGLPPAAPHEHGHEHG